MFVRIGEKGWKKRPRIANNSPWPQHSDESAEKKSYDSDVLSRTLQPQLKELGLLQRMVSL